MFTTGCEHSLHPQADPRASREGGERFLSLHAQLGIHPPVGFETPRIRVDRLIGVHQYDCHADRCSNGYLPLAISEGLVWRDARHAGGKSRAETQPLHENRGQIRQLL